MHIAPTWIRGAVGIQGFQKLHAECSFQGVFNILILMLGVSFLIPVVLKYNQRYPFIDNEA